MHFTKVLAVLAIVLLAAGCTQQPQQPAGQPGVDAKGDGIVAASFPVVKQGDTVKVEYVGKFPDGEVFDKSEGRGPLEFVAGAGQMIKGFDAAVIGMKVNEEKTVTIPPEEAYGALEDAKVVNIPLSQIQVDGNLSVGQTLYTASGATAEVIEIKDGNASLRIAHPMAGKTLVFWIKIVSIN